MINEFDDLSRVSQRSVSGVMRAMRLLCCIGLRCVMCVVWYRLCGVCCVLCGVCCELCVVCVSVVLCACVVCVV